MTVDVRWGPTLVKSTNSKEPRQEVPWREGLRASDLLAGEGFRDIDMEHILVVLNGEQSDSTASLADGDAVEFMVSIQGG